MEKIIHLYPIPGSVSRVGLPGVTRSVEMYVGIIGVFIGVGNVWNWWWWWFRSVHGGDILLLFLLLSPLSVARKLASISYLPTTRFSVFFVSACKAIPCYAPFYTQLTFFYLTSQDFFLLTFNDDVVLLLLAWRQFSKKLDF